VRATGFRAAAERVLDRAGFLDRLLWLRARSGRRDLVVLSYHRPGTDAGELDPGLVDVSPDELAAQLDVLCQSATAVSLADVRRFLRGRRAPPNAVLVTFDDGYTDVEAAVPLLRKAGVPATFFVPTAFPDGGRLFWWDRVWLILHRTRRPSFDLAYPARLSVHPSRGVSVAARAIIDAVKRAERLDLARLWEDLERASGVVLDPAEERALAGRTHLGWGAVKRLRDVGFDVQSHSHEHLILNALAPEAARRDLARSARVLREALGEAPSAVAYPVGYQLTGAHHRVAPEAGFEIGFTNGTGLCALGSADPFNLPRVSMDLGVGSGGFRSRLLLGDAQWGRPTWVPASSEAPPSRRACNEVRG
jgi:peptidoglycan/xylan/chitin deacetylase (PgdA/CDA1 family)